MKIRTIILGISALLMLSSCGDFELLSTAKGKFSGGFGSQTDPYIIKTTEDLLMIKDYSDRYFKLEADIDLAEKEWPKMDLSGHIDGNGHTISNLTISQAGDTLGFVSCLTGTIKNLTISGIYINAGASDYVGGFAGYVLEGEIENCTLLLNESSKILGNEAVGGIAGYIDRTSEEGKFIGNTVKSGSTGYVISGSCLVGSMAGGAYNEIEFVNCHAAVNIYGGNLVGGIIGRSYCGNPMTNCSYSGNIYGVKFVGGLCGRENSCTYTTNYYGCKVDATVTAKEGFVGGMEACDTYSKVSHYYGCYANGKVICENDNAGHVSGFTHNCTTEFCFSTMTSDHPFFYAFGAEVNATDCASVAPSPGNDYTSCDRSCTNIVEFLQSCYSEYADYFNFANTWTWAGYINDEFVNVQCPKLSWEL